MFGIEDLGINIGGFKYRNKKWKVLRELFVLDLCDVAGEDKKREELVKVKQCLHNLLKVLCSMVGSIVIARVTCPTVTSWVQQTFSVRERVFQGSKDQLK